MTLVDRLPGPDSDSDSDSDSTHTWRQINCYRHSTPSSQFHDELLTLSHHSRGWQACNNSRLKTSFGLWIWTSCTFRCGDCVSTHSMSALSVQERSCGMCMSLRALDNSDVNPGTRWTPYNSFTNNIQACWTLRFLSRKTWPARLCPLQIALAKLTFPTASIFTWICAGGWLSVMCFVERSSQSCCDNSLVYRCITMFTARPFHAYSSMRFGICASSCRMVDNLPPIRRHARPRSLQHRGCPKCSQESLSVIGPAKETCMMASSRSV